VVGFFLVKLTPKKRKNFQIEVGDSPSMKQTGKLDQPGLNILFRIGPKSSATETGIRVLTPKAFPENFLCFDITTMGDVTVSTPGCVLRIWVHMVWTLEATSVNSYCVFLMHFHPMSLSCPSNDD